MTRAEGFFYRLASGIQTSVPLVLVTAHPDDETLSCGGSLGLCPQAVVVQLTDGSHPDPAQWAKVGVSTRADYAAVRQAERDAAKTAAGWAHRVIDGGVPDQAVHEHFPALRAWLRPMLGAATVVMTHPYEGGHPDHDATAYLVQTVCDDLAAQAPERVEFASYHWNGARRVTGAFWTDPTVRDWTITLTPERRAQKARACAAYVSQAKFLSRFPMTQERYRIAPRYDFTQPPPTPACLYDRKRWPLSNAALRAAMARVA